MKNVAFGWLWFFTPYNIYQCSQFEPIDPFLALLFMLELTVKDIALLWTHVLQSTVTPLVEGYGGYALRLEVVPIESAYPGFGELVVHLPLTHCWFLFASSYWVCVDVTTVKECGYAAGRQIGRQTDRGLFSEEVL